MSELKVLRYLPLLFLWPRKVVNTTVEDSIQDNFERNEEFARAYEDGVPPEKRNEFAVWHEQQVNEIRSLIGRSFLWVAGTFILAWPPALYLGEKLTPYVSYLQAISAFMILWSIFGKAGWSIQTSDGETLPEKINEAWFRILTWVGIYLLVLSLLV